MNSVGLPFGRFSRTNYSGSSGGVDGGELLSSGHSHSTISPKSLETTTTEEEDCSHVFAKRQEAIQSAGGIEGTLRRKDTIGSNAVVKPLSWDDFAIISKIGQGSFGEVYLCQRIRGFRYSSNHHCSPKAEVCVIKAVSKRVIVKQGDLKHIRTERDLLGYCRSEWLVKLLYAFQDEEYLYLAMEFVPGGDYRTLLDKGCVDYQQARYYVAEMFSAVSALHDMGYIHRDVKPENFLVDAEGHIKLTDFGLACRKQTKEEWVSWKALSIAKEAEPRGTTSSSLYAQFFSSLACQRTYNVAADNNRCALSERAPSFAGSAEYMSIEMVQHEEYNHTVDYWSIACILYHTLVGDSPFLGRSTEAIHLNIRRYERLQRPRYSNGQWVFSDRTWQFMRRIITRPENRLQSLKEVQGQSYFREIEWETLRRRRPLRVPELESEVDAGYFDDFDDAADAEKYSEVMREAERAKAEARMVDPSKVDFSWFDFNNENTRKNGSRGEEDARIKLTESK